MSTRANIIFIDHELKNKTVKNLEKESYCIMYCHNDGYPDGLGKLIREATRYAYDRVKDSVYLTMNIINYVSNKNRKDIQNNKLTGYGISKYINFDIEYLYIIDTENTLIHCYEIDYGDIEKNKIGEKLYTEIYYIPVEI